MKRAAVPSILVVVVLVAFAVIAEAQQPKIYRVGYLSPRLSIESSEEAFRRGLRELGYVEGQNLAIEWRFAKGNNDLLPELAAELVRLRVNKLYPRGRRSCDSSCQAID